MVWDVFATSARDIYFKYSAHGVEKKSRPSSCGAPMLGKNQECATLGSMERSSHLDWITWFGPDVAWIFLVMWWA